MAVVYNLRPSLIKSINDENVNREVPFEGLHWLIDQAETRSERSLDRVKARGDGIAVQNRMAFQGGYFIDRYARQAAAHTPPIRRMLTLGVPVGAGMDARRVSSGNPCCRSTGS